MLIIHKNISWFQRMRLRDKSISVTLTVTFADGENQNRINWTSHLTETTELISLRQDTTLCEGHMRRFGGIAQALSCEGNKAE